MKHILACNLDPLLPFLYSIKRGSQPCGVRPGAIGSTTSYLELRAIPAALCVMWTAALMVFVTQLLSPPALVAASNDGTIHLRDYVSCQFETDDEKTFRDTYTSPFVRSQQAALHTLALATEQKLAKQWIVAVTKAQDPLQLQAAINSITVPDVQTAVQRSVTEANKVSAEQQLKTPVDLQCSHSLLSWNEASDIFGRRIANTYLVVQVVVRNLNQDNDYLIQDVVLAAPSAKFNSGRDKLLARGVAIVGQSLDPRNQVMSALDTLAAASAAVALIGTQGAVVSSNFKSLQNANNVLTAFIPPFKRWFPDYTVDQLNRLNDLAFSASTTYKMIVPKGGSVPFATFIPQKLFLKKVHDWNSIDFINNDNNTLVLVAGMHIQEVPGPSIGSLVPPSGSQGSSVSINGTNFGATQGSGGVKFGSKEATITSWSPSAIVATVPNVPVGPAAVVVSAGGKDSSPATFTVNCPTAGPCITYLSPPSGAAGASITITGKSFGTVAGTVKFGDVSETVTAAAWTDTSIAATVPNNAPVGPVDVTVSAAGVTSPPASFTVNCPAAPTPCITSLSASTVKAAGPTLTITGLNFGSQPQSVKFVGTTTTTVSGSNITSWMPTSITISVPAGLANGAENVVVTVGGQDSPPATFTAP